MTDKGLTPVAKRAIAVGLFIVTLAVAIGMCVLVDWAFARVSGEQFNFRIGATVGPAVGLVGGLTIAALWSNKRRKKA